jgi:hypothetical protein
MEKLLYDIPHQRLLLDKHVPHSKKHLPVPTVFGRGMAVNDKHDLLLDVLIQDRFYDVSISEHIQLSLMDHQSMDTLTLLAYAHDFYVRLPV